MQFNETSTNTHVNDALLQNETDFNNFTGFNCFETIALEDGWNHASQIPTDLPVNNKKEVKWNLLTT